MASKKPSGRRSETRSGAPLFSLAVPITPTLRAVFDGLDADELNALLIAPGTTQFLRTATPFPRLLTLSGGQWIPATGRTRFLQGTLPTTATALGARSLVQIDPTGNAAERVLAAQTTLSDPHATLAGATALAEQALPDLTQLNTRLAAAPNADLSLLRPLPMRMRTAMDPRLQLALLNRRTGKASVAIASATADEVPVIARVTSFDDWSAIPDVHPGASLGRSSDGSELVTGRIPLDQIEAVRDNSVIRSLKASQPVHTALVKTIETMGVRQDLLPSGVAPQGGKGVVVGIVDTGGDFQHLNFRRADGSTRLLALWHQSGVATTSSPFGYGRLYTQAEIDAALATADPYATLGYAPRPDSVQQQGTHGTHVMDIAAGNGLGTTVPGVAPEADLVFVEMAATDVAWTGPDTVKQSFGDSAQMLEAIRFIFDLAGARPCVVNLSLGTNGGPHDGSSLVEQGIDALVNGHPNRAVVIAASNSQLDGIHTSGEVPSDDHFDIGWSVIDEAGGEFELWYDGARRLEITLIGPDNTNFGAVQPGDSSPIGSGATPVIFISNRLDDPNNHCNVIGIWLAEKLPGGTWTVRLRSLDGRPVEFHAWIERLDGAQSSFVNPVPTHTLGSISTGREAVVVGSYDAHKPGFPLSSFSSCGPTRDGREKPEISAPGQNVVAARSRTKTGVVRKSGTSMAAPAVTGLIALMLAEAARTGTVLTSAALRAKLLAGTDRPPPAGPAGSWDPRFGSGRASGRAI